MDLSRCVAIIGAACRFPNGDTIDEFWKSLVNGVNSSVEIPPDRWNNDAFYSVDKDAVGKMYVRHAALLTDIRGFDNKVFNITDEEARYMDVQQKLTLEVVFKALENAGLSIAEMNGSDTAVFIGQMNNDYNASFTPNDFTSYSATGSARSIVSNRVSFQFDLRGASATIDTACSSALTCLHLGIQSILSGESTMAICGGVNATLSPASMIALAKARMSTEKGQCFTFSNQADGYLKGEGCGIVIIKNLDEAIRDGDNIWCAITTGVNQDGSTVTPITTPSRVQQEALIERLYKQCSIRPEYIQYIEAHGTGTKAGDPVETRALGNTIGAARKRTGKGKCPIGSVKTNIGHLESAAGIAGLIKIMLMMKHRKYVPSLHFDVPNPDIDFDSLNLTVTTQVADWPAKNGSPDMACVNSFGFGGTNVHAVIQEIREKLPERTNLSEDDSLRLWPVVFSAATPEALLATAKHCVDALHTDTPSCHLQQLAFTSTARRTHFRYRLSFLANNMTELKTNIARRVSQPLSSSESVARNTRVVFVCCGMGTTFAGMGSELRRLEPVFEEALQAVDKLIMECTGWSVIDKMSSEHHMSQPEFSQPALFAIQVSLLKLLHFWGIVPSAIIGHSVGEVAASYLAKRLSLQDCVKVICHRGSLMSKVSGGSMMVAENFAPGVVDTVLKSFTGRVSIAAVNATNCYTLSGDSSALDEVASQLSAYQTGGQLLKKLNVNTAFHSHHMDPILNELRNALRGIKPVSVTGADSIMAYSTVTGKLAAEWDLSEPNYWVNNARGCVLFQSAFMNCLQAMTTATKPVIVEIGPRPALGRYMRDIATSLGMKPTVLATMKPPAEQKEMFTTLTSLYEVGLEPSWKNVFKGHETNICQIPEYQYQKKDLWHDLELFREQRVASIKQSTHGSSHCFVQKPTVENSTCVVHLNAPETDFVNEHQLGGIPTVPGAMYLELGMAGISLNTRFKPEMITFSISFDRLLQLTHSSEKTMPVEINVWQRDTPDWNNNNRPSFDFDIAMNNVQYASGYAEVRTELCALPWPISLREIRLRCTKLVNHDSFYARMTKANFTYGRRFRTVQSCYYSNSECLAEIIMCDEMIDQLQRSILHPCLGDAVLQLSFMFKDESLVSSSVQLVPRCIRRVNVLRTPEKSMYIHVRRNNSSNKIANSDSLVYDAVIVNLLGEVYVTLDGVTVTATDVEIACNAVGCMYSLTWSPPDQCTSNEVIESFMKTAYPENNALSDPSSKINYIVFSDTDGTATRILEEVRSRGVCGSDTQFISADKKLITSFHNDFNQLQHMLKNPIQFYQKVLYCWPLNGNISESSSSEEVLSAVIDVCFSLCQIVKYIISSNVNIPIVVVTRNVCELLHSAETVADCDRSNLLRGVIGYTIQSTIRTIALEPDSPSIRCVDLTMCDDADIIALASSLEDEEPHLELSFYQGKQWKPELLPGRCQLDSMLLKGHYAAHLPYQLVEINKQQYTFSPLIQSRASSPSVKNGLSKNGCNNYTQCSVRKVRIDTLSLFHAEQEREDKQTVLAADIFGCIETREGKARSEKVHVLGPCTSASEQSVNIHRCVPFALFPVDKPVISIVYLAWYIAVEVSRLGDLLRHSRPEITFINAIPEVRAIKSVLDGLVKQNKNGNSRKASPLTVAIQFAKTSTDVRAFVSKASTSGVCFSVILTNQPILDSVIINSSDSHEVVYVPGLFLSDNIYRFKKFKDWLRKSETWLRQQYEDNEMRFDTSSLELVTRSGDQINSIKFSNNQKMHVLDLTPYKDVVPVALSLHTLFRPNAHYIVVGGSRGLGWELIKHMATVGANNITSWSRHLPDKAILEEEINLAKNTSCNITFQQVEVSDYVGVEKALMESRKLFPGTDLGGIFYGAVVLNDAALVKMDLHRFVTVVQAKVKGTWNLHNLTKHQRLEFFVLHSSIAAVLGNSGQTNYAAANAFQDAMAVYRRKTGLVGQSINWSALNVGVIRESAIATQRLKAEGLTPLSVVDIKECFDYALLSNIPRVLCARINWRVMLKKCINDAQLIKRMYLFPFFTQRFDQFVQTVQFIRLTQNKREVPNGEQVDEVKDFVRKVFSENVPEFDREPNDDVDAYTLGADSLNVISIVSNVRKVYNVPPTALQALSSLTVNEVYNVILKHVNPADVGVVQSDVEKDVNDVKQSSMNTTETVKWKGNVEHMEEATHL